MLHRTVQTFQRAALRQSSVCQHGHVHGFRFQPGPLYTITRSLHDDSDGLSSSQNSSQGPSYQSWSVDRINSLQSDVATTKLQLDHFKESTNTKISGLQTGFTGQISAIESKFDSKFDTFSREIRHSMSELKAELMQKMSELRAESKQNMLELTAESKQNMLELRAESKQNMSDIMNQVRQHEVQLVWRMFFAFAGITIMAIGGAATIFMRDHFPLQKIPHVEQVPLQQIPHVKGK